MSKYAKPTSMTIGDYCWKLGKDGRYVMHDGFVGSYYQCGVTESLLVETLAKSEQQKSEIARLRLTDEEQTAVRLAIACCEDITYGSAEPEAAATLRKLLERLK